MEELQSENDSLKEKAASYETKSRHLISTWYPSKAVRFILGVRMEIDIDEILKQARRTEMSLRSKSLRLSAVSGSALLTMPNGSVRAVALGSQRLETAARWPEALWETKPDSFFLFQPLRCV